jgi:hypothetical protein
MAAIDLRSLLLHDCYKIKDPGCRMAARVQDLGFRISAHGSRLPTSGLLLSWLQYGCYWVQDPSFSLAIKVSGPELRYNSMEFFSSVFSLKAPTYL